MARAVPLIVIAFAGVTLLWSRLIMLTQGLWGDEAFSVAKYITRGPSAIWDASTWLPNDHLLFEIFTWATAGIFGAHSEAIYRLWGVIPAICAAVVMTWWLWRRVDMWAAAIFAVFATVTPLYWSLSWQARGYGLGFLCAVLVLVAADGISRPGSVRATALFALSGFLGMATLENFVGLFILTAAALVAFCSASRRRTIIAVLLAGLATALWYAPLLTKIIGYHNTYGRPLPWDGFVTAPLQDVFGTGIRTLAPGISVTVGAIVAACLLAVAAFELWRRCERLLLGLFIASILGTYLLIEVLAGYTPRFASFAVLPLDALAAIGLSTLTRWLTRTPREDPLWYRGSSKRAQPRDQPLFSGRRRPVADAAREAPPHDAPDRTDYASAAPSSPQAVSRHRRTAGILTAALILAACSLLVLARFTNYAGTYSQVPFEAAKNAADLVKGLPRADTRTVFIGHGRNFANEAFIFYLQPRKPKSRPARALQRLFCSDRSAYVYFEQLFAPPAPSTRCLVRRQALRVAIREHRTKLTLWLVPPLGAQRLK